MVSNVGDSLKVRQVFHDVIYPASAICRLHKPRTAVPALAKEPGNSCNRKFPHVARHHSGFTKNVEQPIDLQRFGRALDSRIPLLFAYVYDRTVGCDAGNGDVVALTVHANYHWTSFHRSILG
jgi:hypothetical protein